MLEALTEPTGKTFQAPGTGFYQMVRRLSPRVDEKKIA
jgi:hypothetical protein